MLPNPYAPPKAQLADLVRDGSAPPLWNPDAAANWSLLFSPAFGAFLHMKNWQALGQATKARTAKVWFLLTVVLLVALTGVSLLEPRSTPLASSLRVIDFFILIAWYFGSARGQAAYVKSNFGTAYPRRGWLKPLGVAVLATFALVILAIVFAWVLRRVR